LSKPAGECNAPSAGVGQVPPAGANPPAAAPGSGANGSNTISTESASEEDAKTKSSSNAGAIAGGIIGAGVVIAALGALVAWLLLFRKKRKASEESEVGLTPALEPPPSDYSLYNPPLGPPSPRVHNYHTAPPIAPQPVQYASQPVQYASQPVQYASQPVQYASQPVQYVSQPLQNAPQPLQYSQQRASDGDTLPVMRGRPGPATTHTRQAHVIAGTHAAAAPVSQAEAVPTSREPEGGSTWTGGGLFDTVAEY
jgi:hypothetical protein